MKTFKRATLAGLLATAAVWTAATGFAHEYRGGNIFVAHPWVREALPESTKQSGFMMITNNGTDDDRLLKVTTDLTDKTELDNVIMENGEMKMVVAPEGVVIPAGKTVMLHHDGSHIMFLDLKSQLKKGAKFKATLEFEKAGKVKVHFDVEGQDYAGMSM